MYAAIASVLLVIVLMAAFIDGRWRYDLVALSGLVAAVALGLVPGDQAFQGFSHPAVITVGAVLVLSRGLEISGASEFLAASTVRAGNGAVSLLRLTGAGALFSSVMNNVGALALLLPIAGRERGDSTRLLMPLAFATILGGLVTSIGTPPNLIIAAYRAEVSGEAFGLLSFAPVGLPVAVAGVAFIVLIGWRLVPNRSTGESDHGDGFQMEDYLAELRLTEGSEAVGRTIAGLDPLIGDLDVKVVGLIRAGRLVPAVPRLAMLQADDILMVEALPRDLQPFIQKLGLVAVDPGAPKAELLRSEEVGLIEAVITTGSRLEGRSVLRARLQRQYGVNLLAVSRKGTPYRGRLRAFRFAAGDVLLLQGEAERLRDVVSSIGCLPLAERGMRPAPPKSQGARRALALFAAAILAGASGLLPISVAMVGGALAMVLSGVLHIRQAYDAVEWPVVMLLAALIPLGHALESSGASHLAGEAMLSALGSLGPVVALMALMVLTVALTNVLNNAATAVLMAPLGVNLAAGLSVSADPFLMGVAVCASCAFLTPIGHQNNALVMGPGQYQFGDYWRLGLPLTLVVCVAALPAILLFWPMSSG